MLAVVRHHYSFEIVNSRPHRRVQDLLCPHTRHHRGVHTRYSNDGGVCTAGAYNCVTTLHSMLPRGLHLHTSAAGCVV